MPTESRFTLWNDGEEYRFTYRLDSKEGEHSSEAYFPLCSARCFVTRRVGFSVVHSGFAEPHACEEEEEEANPDQGVSICHWLRFHTGSEVDGKRVTMLVY